MNKRMRRSLDLTSKKQPDEKVYTQLQMTRIINYITFKALRSLRKLILVMTATLVVALGIYALVQHGQNNKLSNSVERVDGVIDRLCAQGVQTRQNLKTLVEVAIGDTDGDGIPDRASTIDLAVLSKTPQYQNLSDSDKAMWNLVLTGLANSNDGDDQSKTTTQSLQDYRTKLIEEPPAACVDPPR